MTAIAIYFCCHCSKARSTGEVRNNFLNAGGLQRREAFAGRWTPGRKRNSKLPVCLRPRSRRNGWRPGSGDRLPRDLRDHFPLRFMVCRRGPGASLGETFEIHRNVHRLADEANVCETFCAWKLKTNQRPAFAYLIDRCACFCFAYLIKFAMFVHGLLLNVITTSTGLFDNQCVN